MPQTPWVEDAEFLVGLIADELALIRDGLAGVRRRECDPLFPEEVAKVLALLKAAHGRVDRVSLKLIVYSWPQEEGAPAEGDRAAEVGAADYIPPHDARTIQRPGVSPRSLES
jgi:hypothetical protein